MANDPDSLFKRFLLPEKELSLKLIFDNLRNYAIIGVLFGLAHWVQGGVTSGTARGFQKLIPVDNKVLAWVILALAAVLFLLNGLQTTELMGRSLDSFWDRGVTQLAWKGRTVGWQNYVIRVLVGGAAFVFFVALGGAIILVFVHVALFAEAGSKY